jgi:hypothetical protein
MDFLYRIAEERIRKAQEDGAFDNLPGKGKPLCLDDDEWLPQELRLTYKILKNANCLPGEIEIRKEIFSLRQLLDAAIDPETRGDLRRELNRLVLRLNLQRRGSVRLDEPEAPAASP